MSRISEKIAYAEGYHSGMLGETFSNPYEDFDLRVQFNYGYRTGCERNLGDQLLEETLHAECTN